MKPGQTQIVKPIFLVGPGRSGTTLTLFLLALHPDLTWFSVWTHQFPQWPQLATLSRLNNLTFLEKATRDLRRWPRPTEALELWDFCFPGFSRADCDWNEQELDKTAADRFVRVIESHLRWHGKKRFMTKYTGFPRFRFLKAMFPDAYFVCIDRDPRAVVYSYMKQKWGFKDKPHLLESMPMRGRLELYAKRYLAIYQVKRKFQVDKDYIQLYYEQLIRSPLTVMQTICQKTALPASDVFERRIASWSMEQNTNQAWKEVLLSEDQAYLTGLLEQPLKEMGYEVS